MSAGEDDGDGPTGTRVPAPSLDLALDDPEHPAWAHRYGEGTVNERLSAAPVPLGLVIRQAIGSRLGEEVPTLAQLVVSFDVELTVLGVVALLELVDHRVPHEARLVIPGFPGGVDRKSTRLNSSHVAISYAVFCLKKKNYSTYRTTCAL